MLDIRVAITPDIAGGQMLKIKTPSRIHMTLIDMNGSLGRDGASGSRSRSRTS
jgi:hypothetical protein